MLIEKRDSLIIGAAIGVGIAAQAAERGGADFLLALAVGRYRVMGAVEKIIWSRFRPILDIENMIQRLIDDIYLIEPQLKAIVS